MGAAAFFDLDKTLLTVNSGRLWMQRERRLGRLGTGPLLLGMYYFARYKMGTVDIERAVSRALTTIKDEQEATVRAWTHTWFDEDVVPFVAPGAAAVVAAHRALGHPCVLLTSSSPYASERAVDFFGLDDALSSEFEVRDGRFTGGFVQPLCYGAGKVTKAAEWAKGRGVDLAQSWFYTDSITDLPMMEAVGHPVAVHPDPRLARIARKRGWPVLDWRRDGEAEQAFLAGLGA